MTESCSHVPPMVWSRLSTEEKSYFVGVFERFGGYPALDQMWTLMDEIWLSCGCDPANPDERLAAFYRHPVWLFNGLFAEQHSESLANRRIFSQWVKMQSPLRIADFGGGYGGLARLIGEELPAAEVEVIEPYPHPAAIAMTEACPNVRYAAELTGTYDIIVATDVFEHVPDPLELAAGTAQYLKIGGKYLIANCFQPVIFCHLPQLFHLSYAWDHVMSRMLLKPGERVGHGRAYSRLGDLRLEDARKSGEMARCLYPLVEKLPAGRGRIGSLLVRAFC